MQLINNLLSMQYTQKDIYVKLYIQTTNYYAFQVYTLQQLQ